MRANDKNRLLVCLFVFLFCLYFTLPSTGIIAPLTGELSLNSQAVYSSANFKFGTRDEGGKKVAFLEATENPVGYTTEVLEKGKKEFRKQLAGIFNSYDIPFKVLEKPNKRAIEYIFPNYSEPSKVEGLIKSQNLFGILPRFLNNWAPRQKITKGLDLQGGVDLLYEIDVSKLEKGDTVRSARARSVEIIRTRIDALGIGEVAIKPESETRIRIQLPGRKDADQIEKLITGQGNLSFHLFVAERATREDFGPYDDEKYAVIQFKANKNRRMGFAKIFKTPALRGKYLKQARVQYDSFNRPIIAISFNSEGASIFADVSGQHIQERLAIVLDFHEDSKVKGKFYGKIYSAPVIQSKIVGGNAIIEGTFGQKEARQLATVLQIGALPARLVQIHKNIVGPSLGRLSIKHGVSATIIGFIAVVIFMMLIYRFCGFLATVAVFFNFVIIFALLVLFKGTLTLPGIAGLILGIGMAVDANIIIFERIKEEFLSGKTVSAAIESGFDRAWICIFDSNVTTLLTVLVLFYVGTGPIKGFAVTLGIGLIANLFTAVYFVKTFLDITYVRTKSKTINIGI